MLDKKEEEQFTIFLASPHQGSGKISFFLVSAPFGSSGFGDRCWFGYRWSVVVSIED